MKIILKKMLEFIFSRDAFKEQCRKEDSERYLNGLNKNKVIQVGQYWRAPLTESDKYCTPILLEIIEVKKEIAYCISNYSRKVNEISFKDLKSKWICFS